MPSAIRTGAFALEYVTMEQWDDNTRKHWLDLADPLTLWLGPDKFPIYASPKLFTSKSVGYFANGKVTLADGTRCQMTLSLVVIGSKPGSKEGETPTSAMDKLPVEKARRNPRKASQMKKGTKMPLELGNPLKSLPEALDPDSAHPDTYEGADTDQS